LSFFGFEEEEMERKTIKTIFIVIGSGIAGILLFIIAIIGFAYYKFYLPYSNPDFISIITRNCSYAT